MKSILFGLSLCFSLLLTSSSANNFKTASADFCPMMQSENGEMCTMHAGADMGSCPMHTAFAPDSAVDEELFSILTQEQVKAMGQEKENPPPQHGEFEGKKMCHNYGKEKNCDCHRMCYNGAPGKDNKCKNYCYEDKCGCRTACNS